MSRIKDVVFSALVAACLLVSVGHIVIAAASSYDVPSRSYLEGREYQTMPEVSTQSIMSGDFQSQSEQFLSDSVPKRDRVALTHAKLEFFVITLANCVFQYEALPTYFDSDHVVDLSEKCVYETPYQEDGQEELARNAARMTGVLAEENPSINWSLALVDRSSTMVNSPLQKLMSKRTNYEYYREIIQSETAASKVCFIDLSDLTEGESTRENYFYTDHHWQIQGALEAYNRIMLSFEKEPIEFGSVFTAYKGPFFGSLDRRGLTEEFHDEVYDISYDHGDYVVRVNGVQKDMSFLCKGYLGTTYKKPTRFANVYADYFHTDYALIEIDNENVSEGALLIVGDSFTNNMERFFAESYKKVYVIDTRFYDGSLQAFLNDHVIDDCVIMMSANDFTDRRFSEAL